MKKTSLFSIIFIFFLIQSYPFIELNAQSTIFKTVRIYNTNSARQGVAVDESHFYTINNTSIEKYNKINGKFISKWEDKSNSLKHFNSALILDDKLLCTHSNYPDLPMTSSIEIFDKESLKHIDTHSFGINYGSCTWLDFYDNFFWACFAHYDKYKVETSKDHRWTILVKFNKDFQEVESWVFPEEVLKRFKPMSSSGGSWGNDGFLYVTGHDSMQVYKLQLPKMGSTLELIDIFHIDSQGQGIAWDRSEANTLFSIRRKNNQVLKSIRL